MSLITSIAPALALLLPAASADDAPVPADAAKFQGTWEVVAMERAGEEADADQLEGMEVVFLGETFRLKGGDESYHGTFVLDSESDPCRITTYVIDNPDGNDDQAAREKMRRVGIYKFEGDKLIICLDEVGQETPDSFDTEGRKGLRKITLEKKD